MIQRGLVEALGDAYQEMLPLTGLNGEARQTALMELGRQALTEVYRQLLLGVITELWVDYLTQMEALRVSIGLEAYAQRDPLVQYKSRASEMYHELVANMRLTLANELAKADWLSPDTKKQALTKLERINPKIGYPTKWRDYTAMKMSAGNLIENLQSAYMWRMNYQIAKLGKPVDRTEWGMTPPTVNAYYSPSMNEIAFPAGILQPPFFDATADDAVNYGAIAAKRSATWAASRWPIAPTTARSTARKGQ